MLDTVISWLKQDNKDAFHPYSTQQAKLIDATAIAIPYTIATAQKLLQGISQLLSMKEMWIVDDLRRIKVMKANVWEG